MLKIDENYAKTLQSAADERVDKDANFVLELPEWYDDEKYKRAQRFYQTNMFTMFPMKICGLLSILAVPSILRVLMHTKKSSTNSTAYCRYMATSLYVNDFYEHDLIPGSDSWKSLTAVRKMHVAGSASSERAGCGIVSQKDMAITQFGFMGYGVLNPKFLGWKGERADFEAFIHFWRVMGYMLGIKDEYNICTDNLETTKLRVQTVLQVFLMPILSNPTSDFIHMTKVIIDGFWCVETSLRYESVMFFTRRLANMRYYHYNTSEIEGAPDQEDLMRNSAYAKMSWYVRFLIGFQVHVLEYWYHFALVRWYFNKKVLVNRFINKHIPLLAICQHGVKHAFVKIHK